MAINNISQFKNTLNLTKSNEWMSSADLKLNNNIQKTVSNNVNPIQTGNGDKTFGDFLLDSISKVNELQKSADTEIKRLATGKTKNIHETMVAIERAEIAFKTMNQVRMKVLDAYKEIMKMQV